MKRLFLGIAVMGLAASALAADKAQLDAQIQKLTTSFETLQSKPDKRIPADTLDKALGVILLDRTKAGFIFAYQGGRGVALVKDPKSKQWSPAAFMKADEASLGFQVGGQQSFIVILLMNTNATRMLTDSTVEFGGEARGTAGNESAGAQGDVNSKQKQLLIYSDRKGLYGGAAVKGGAVSPDEKANRDYYGQFLTMKEILYDKKVKPTDTAIALANKIKEASKK